MVGAFMVSSKYVDMMWEILNDAIPTYKGKLCVPITGGLDSRVIAGIISKRQRIDLSYCFYDERTKFNWQHAAEIAKRLDVHNFYAIKLGGKRRHRFIKDYLSVEPLNYDLKEYTLIHGNHANTITGSRVTPLNYFRTFTDFWYQTVPDYDKSNEYLTTIFKRVEKPTWDPRFIGFCLSLPRRYRFMQYLYKEMIKKYLPDLADIPRCFESGSKPIQFQNHYRYFYERFLWNLLNMKKKINRKLFR